MSGITQLKISNNALAKTTTFAATSNAVAFNFNSVTFNTEENTSVAFKINVNASDVFKVEALTSIVDMDGLTLQVQDGDVNSTSLQAVNGRQLFHEESRAIVAEELNSTAIADEASRADAEEVAIRSTINQLSFPSSDTLYSAGSNLDKSSGGTDGGSFFLKTDLTNMSTAKFSGEVTALEIICSSDRRLKENIEELDVDKVLADVANVKSYTYNFKKSPEDPRWGFIAQEVKAGPLAHLVNGEETEDSYLGINYVDMIAVIPALVQKVLALEKKVSEM